MLTKRVSVSGYLVAGLTVQSAIVNFVVDTVNPIVIKSLAVATIINGKGSTADVVMSIGSSIALYPDNDIIDVDSSSVVLGSASNLLALPNNNQILVNIPIGPNKQLNFETIIALTNNAVDDVEFVSTLIINYEVQ